MMLKVVSTERADEIIEGSFSAYALQTEGVSIERLCGRVLAEDIRSLENVPSFDRVTVDGYAVRSGDTFGSSESMPSQLEILGEILMGDEARQSIATGQCIKISTGGMLPEGADSAVMVENTEEAFDGSCRVYKAVSPFENVTKKGDDVKIGDMVLEKGTCLSSKHIGVLASLGVTEAECFKKIRVGIISSGDEVVSIENTPAPGQVRDVNSHILYALCLEAGCECIKYGIVTDNYEKLYTTVKKALSECDIILLSGGSSAGARDMTVKVIGELGRVLLHGIAMKPGKPTIVGEIGGKAVFAVLHDGVTRDGGGRHHHVLGNRLFVRFYGLFFTRTKLHYAVGMRHSRRFTNEYRGVELLRNLIGKLNKFLCFLRAGRFQHRDMRASCIEAGILLVLRAVHTGVVGNTDDHTRIHARISNGKQGICRYVQADVLHARHRPAACNSRTDCHFHGNLFVGCPFRINAVHHGKVFRNLRAGGARVCGQNLYPCFPRAARDCLVCKHQFFHVYKPPLFFFQIEFLSPMSLMKPLNKQTQAISSCAFFTSTSHVQLRPARAVSRAMKLISSSPTGRRY